MFKDKSSFPREGKSAYHISAIRSHLQSLGYSSYEGTKINYVGIAWKYPNYWYVKNIYSSSMPFREMSDLVVEDSESEEPKCTKSALEFFSDLIEKEEQQTIDPFDSFSEELVDTLVSEDNQVATNTLSTKVMLAYYKKIKK